MCTDLHVFDSCIVGFYVFLILQRHVQGVSSGYLSFLKGTFKKASRLGRGHPADRLNENTAIQLPDNVIINKTPSDPAMAHLQVKVFDEVASRNGFYGPNSVLIKYL